MPTVIDELIVKLGLDPNEYRKGQEKVRQEQKKTEESSHKFSSTVTESSKKTADGILKLRDAMLGMAAVFVGVEAVGAFKRFATDALKNANQVDLLSRNIGVGTRKILEFRQAVQLNGGTSGQADSILQKAAVLAQDINKFGGRGSPEAIAMLKFAGVGFRSGKATPLSVMEDEANAVRAANAKGTGLLLLESLGLQGLMPLFGKGAGGISASMSAQSQTADLTRKQADALHEFNQNMQQLGFYVDQVGRELMIALLPGLKKLDGFLRRHGGISGAVTDEVIAPAFAAAGAVKDALVYLPYTSDVLRRYSHQVDKKNGLPDGMTLSIMNTERTHMDSSTRTYAVSSKGARGLMQFMPGTWAQYGKGDINNPFDALEAAGRFEKALYARYHGNAAAVAAAYNGGTLQGNLVAMGKNATFPETRGYVARNKVLRGEMSRDVNIQQVTINTQATDAKGVAKDFQKHLQSYHFAAQADTGLQ